METVFGLCFELNCQFFICDYSFKKGRKRVQKLSSLTDHVDALASLIHEKRAGGGRLIVAIAGAPGSGKSTLAKEVARRISLQKCPCIVVPMDGFHLDNAILEDLNLMARKGAPETFDVGGFTRIIKAIKSGVDVYAPLFDRPRDLSIAGAMHVSADLHVVIVEGNYLMFDADGWRDLAPLWDITARLDVPLPELRARLIQRWLSLNHSRLVATRRAEGNDIPNAQAVIDFALPCDLTLDGQPRS